MYSGSIPDVASNDFPARSMARLPRWGSAGDRCFAALSEQAIEIAQMSRDLEIIFEGRRKIGQLTALAAAAFPPQATKMNFHRPGRDSKKLGALLLRVTGANCTRNPELGNSPLEHPGLNRRQAISRDRRKKLSHIGSFGVDSPNS